MEKKIRTIASLSTRSFSAYLDEVLLQNNQMGRRIRIDHPEAAAIIPYVKTGEVFFNLQVSSSLPCYVYSATLTTRGVALRPLPS